MSRLKAPDRREKIIRAAISLFSRRGFRGTTTRELARSAGISEALLFRHFPNKKRLYQAILSSKIEEQLPSLLRELPAGGNPRQVLLDLGRRIMAQNEKDPVFMRLLLFSALEGHELSDLFFQRRTLPILDFLKNFLRDQERAGTIRSTEHETTARAFLGMIFGLVQTRILFRIPQVVRRSTDEILKQYVALFLRGIER